MSRIARAEVLKLKEQEYVLASRTLGAKSFRIIFKEILNNVNEQEYTASIENCGNFIYVQGAADDDGSQPVTTVDGEGAAGLDLIEVFCDATDIARKYQQGETEVTIPLNTYIAMLKTRGSAELENYGKNINFVST